MVSVWNSVHSSASGARKNEGTGIGLQNTRQRLQELYGTEGRLTIKSGAGLGGWLVAIELPFTDAANEELRLIA